MKWRTLTVHDANGRDVGDIHRLDDPWQPDRYLATCQHCPGTLTAHTLTDALGYLTEPGHYDCPLTERTTP